MVKLIAALLAGTAAAGDWTHWRGPEQNGTVRDKATVTSWSPEGENLLWAAPIGGRTTPIIHGGRVLLIGPAGEGPTLGERVICLEADSGRVLWERRFPVFHTDIVENRVGWTALAADPQTGWIYAHGTGGELFCFDREGELVWKVSLVEEFGRFSGYGGRLYTPIVDEDRVILSFLSMGWGDHSSLAQRFVAFDKRSGAVLWWAAPGERPLDTTYATPRVAVIGGRRLLIAPGADGWVYGLAVRTGETIWKFRASARPLNTSPVVSGDLVYVTHSEENIDTTVMGRIVCFDGTGQGDITASAERWRVDGVDAGYTSPVLAADRLYVLDNSANLWCFDAASGRRIWDFGLGRIARGSPVVTADGVIYAPELNGRFYILRDAGDRCELLHRHEFPPFNEAIVEIQGSPAIAGGRVYFQTRYSTYCLGRREAAAQAAAPPPPAPATPGDNGAAPRLLIVPAEVTLRPGQSLRFAARLYDERTAVGRDQTGRWSVQGVHGTIDAEGTFRAAAENRWSAGHVRVEAGGLEAAARVRICPLPPFVEDFESCDPNGNPPGWLHVIGKTRVVERDGGKVLLHQAERPTPAIMRIRTFMTPPLADGYTIEADVLGALRPPHWKPDVGLVNSRYELVLLGSEPTLRITTWPAIPRLQKDVPFPWAADTWYRMKFQVRLEGDVARLRGKVWPRGQPEPAEWTVELDDPFPNREGSPALYSYSAGATASRKGIEAYFDNVKVTPND